MSQDRGADIRARLAERLEELGHPEGYAWLAARVNVNRGQVWKWATGDTKTFPASFAAQLEEARVVAARWLLTGEGSPEIGPEREVDEAFARIAAIVDQVRATEPASSARGKAGRGRKAIDEVRPEKKPAGPRKKRG